MQVGTISVFYYALLTNRAFQINTYGELPGFERAWDPTLSEINWWGFSWLINLSNTFQNICR